MSLTCDPAELAARARGRGRARDAGLLRRLALTGRSATTVCVHAGVDPERPLAEQGRRELLWLREPFLSGRGWRHPFAVVHGHTIRGPEVLRHRIAVDSGAYRTGVLTAVQLAGDRLRFFCVTSEPKLKAFKRLPGLYQRRRFSPPEPIAPGRSRRRALARRRPTRSLSAQSIASGRLPRGGGNGPVDRGQVLGAKRQVERRGVGLDMLEPAGLGDRDHARLRQHPGQRHLERGCGRGAGRCSPSTPVVGSRPCSIGL